MTRRAESPYLAMPQALPAAAARAIDIDDLDMFGAEYREAGSPTASRIGMILFWSAVACLLLARVALFDPSVARPVGSFAGQSVTVQNPT